jgi:hypothetical protein
VSVPAVVVVVLFVSTFAAWFVGREQGRSERRRRQPPGDPWRP